MQEPHDSTPFAMFCTLLCGAGMLLLVVLAFVQAVVQMAGGRG